MTKAICWECGEFKFGAFLPCSACNSEPTDDYEIMVSLLLTDNDHSEDELISLQERIRRGAKVEITEEMRTALLPAVEVAKRISGIGNKISSEVHDTTFRSTNLSSKWIKELHKWVARREPVAILLFHVWRTSLIVVLILAIISAFQGNLVYLWNPVAFCVIIIGIGYSVASIFLSSSNLNKRLVKCRSYFVSAVISIIVVYFVNPSPWSIPFTGLHLSATTLSIWAVAMGVASALRGDFDSAM